MLTDPDLAFFREQMASVTVASTVLDETDKNLAAFRSTRDFIDWYGQPPAPDGTHYRDRAFYVRELAYLSRTIQPRTIVEVGTSLGIGTCLLHWLNPAAQLISVDIARMTFLPNGQSVPIGWLAKLQGLAYTQRIADSATYAHPNVDFCFIDGDHTEDAVWLDSERAWANKSADHPWAIAWHDHNERHPGVLKAVADRCAAWGVALQSRPDSDTVWIHGC
jgi:hypothetical protein